MFTCSTIALPLPDSTRSTRPRAPRLLPAVTSTWSFFRIFSFSMPCSFALCRRLAPSDDLGRQRHDLHEPPLPQLARHRPEDAGADRLAGVADQHRGVGVEADVEIG